MRKFYFLILVCSLVFSFSAQAHVTIRNYANGIDSISGKTDHFRLNVPTNRGKAVTKVRMVVPENVSVMFIHPMAGWKYEAKKNASGKITEIIYSGRMEAGEFMAFPLIIKNPDKGDSTAAYKTYVTYADGVVVPFDGSEAAHGYVPQIFLK